MKKTKILCTLGPSTDSMEILSDMVLAGMNGARFNLSHGSHQDHKKRLDMLVKIREDLNMPIAALLDTKGPEIRLGKFKNRNATLVEGKLFTLTSDDILGDETICKISYPELYKDVKIGTRILLDDGLIELSVQKFCGKNIVCCIENGGIIYDNKGLNVPNIRLSIPYISKQDKEDIVFAIESGFDFIAASFTRCAEDILEIRKILKEYNCTWINIIAKIENLDGVRNIDEILQVADGIMVARGDMGVEIDFVKIPVIQKELIKKAYNSGKQVITATQMLESMIKNPRPTRAEATDVANAIYDGTSAIMLSGETAIGMYPVETVQTMSKIAEYTERDIDYVKRLKNRTDDITPDVTNAISHATCTTAIELNVPAIITITKSGRTARMISRYRPLTPIIGCTPSKSVYRQLSMSWGVTPVIIKEVSDTDLLFKEAIDAAKETSMVKPGDVVILTAGLPLGLSGTTNLLKVERI